MFDLSLFRKPAFAGASIAAFALSASMFSMFLYLTLYLQNMLGFSPLEAGVRFLPLTLAVVLRRAARRAAVGAAADPLLFGVGLGLVGSGCSSWRIDADSDWTALLPGFLLGRRGHRPDQPAARDDRGRRRAAAARRHGVGHQHHFRQVGIATGIAGLGALFQHLLINKPRPARSPASPRRCSPPASRASRAPRRRRSTPTCETFTSALNDLFVVGADRRAHGGVLSALLIRRSDFIVTQGREESARQEAAAEVG